LGYDGGRLNGTGGGETNGEAEGPGLANLEAGRFEALADDGGLVEPGQGSDFIQEARITGVIRTRMEWLGIDGDC
jgi:hypothetical protein